MKTLFILLFTFFLSMNLFSQNRLWVTTTSSGTGSTDDRSFKILTDGSGNTYVTGKCTTTGFGIGTAKYNSSGVQLWFVGYSGNVNDEATGIALDNQNDVYICGKHWNGANFDYILIKYAGANGAEEWGGPKFYAGTAGGDDVATAVAIETEESPYNGIYVYVTGYSLETHTPSGAYEPNYDITTIKYNTQDGSTVWPSPNKFDSPDESNEGLIGGHGDDKAFAIALVPHGNAYGNEAVYVCGSSWHQFTIGHQGVPKTSNSMVQIDNVTGTTTAYNYYNAGVYPPGIELFDVGVALGVSPRFGKIYQAGYKHKDVGSPTKTDLFLLQNKKGLWVNDCSSPYVSHQCEDWCGTFVDNSQNQCYNEINFTDQGDESGLSLAIIDGTTSASQIVIYVAGSKASASEGLDFVTIRFHGTPGRPSDECADHYPYDGAGTDNPIVAIYDGSAHGDDVVRSISVSPTGNVYVTGTSSQIVGSRSNDRFTIAEYNSNLAPIWTDVYPRSTDPNNTNNNSEGFGITIDNSGYIYATGYSYSSSTGNDYTTIKYAPVGPGNPNELNTI